MSDDKNTSTKSSEVNTQIDNHLFGNKGKQSQQALSATHAKVFSTIARVRDILSTDGIADSVNDSTNLIRVLKTEDEKLAKTQDKSDGNTNKQLSKQLDSAAKSISNELDITSMFAGEETRLKNYQVYTQIAEYIVQVMEAVDTYTDNILSPDSFNNTSLPIVLRHNITDEDIRNRVYSRVKSINELYGIYPKIENAIKKSIYLGDYFIATLDLTRRMSELLSESVDSDIAYNSVLTSADISKVINSIEQQHKSINEDFDILSHYSIIDESGDSTTVTDEVLAEGVSHYMDSICIINEDSSAMIKAIKQKENIYNSDIASKIAERKGKGAAEKVKFNKSLGSLVKEYEPQNVIKITDGNIIFGYLLIDFNNTTYDQLATKSNNSVYQNMSDTFSTTSKTSATNKYLDIITRSIVQKVKLNPKLVQDNVDLADIFHNAIIRSKTEGKQFAVTFAYPNEVHHFKPTNDVYGVSVLDKVKFFAKLYIGVLTNAFMSNAIRKNERLAYYIDVTGNDNDVYNSVNDLVRTIKQREIKFSNMDSISTVLSSAGEFHDFFIPVANGNRPVDIEPISLGQPKDVDTPFIEFLKKNIITGTGVPASFMSSMEDVEFSRQLSMENGKFLRRIIRLQGIYNPVATNVIREIYDNEFVPKVDNSEKKKNTKTSVNSNKISVEEQLSSLPSTVIEMKLPTPSTLSIRVQEEQLQTANSQAETISDIEIDDTNDLLKREFKRLLIRKLLPSIDWDEIDSIKLNAERIVAKSVGVGASDDDSDDANSGDFGRKW